MRTTPLAGALGLALVAPLALGPLTLVAATAPGARSGPQAQAQPVLLYWSASLIPDSDAAPTEFLVRIMKHMRTAHPDASLRVLTDAFGANKTIHWFAEQESLSARMQLEQELDADREWLALIEEAGEIFETDTLHNLFPLGGAAVTDWSKPVRQLWITRSPPDRVHAARRHARQVVEYLEANYDAVDARAYAPDMVEPGTIYWMVDYESTDTWEALRTELLVDDAYAELFEGVEGMFLEGSKNELLKNF